MGTRGPIGKRTRQRERDERRLRERDIVVDGRGQRAPNLPAGVKVSPTARAWWRALWASSLSSTFRKVDLPALVRLVVLWDRFLAGDTTGTELAEIRQLEDRFGLSLQARRRLQVRFTDDEPEDAPARRTTPTDLGPRVVQLRERLGG